MKALFTNHLYSTFLGLSLYCMLGTTAVPRDVSLSVTEKGDIAVSWKSVLSTQTSSYISQILYTPVQPNTDTTVIFKNTLKEEKQPLFLGGYFETHVILKDLLSSQVYFYQCGNENDGWSPIYSFKTPNTLSHQANFMILGEMHDLPTVDNALSSIAARVRYI